MGSKRVLLTFDIEGPPGREDFMDSPTLGMIKKFLKFMEKQGLQGIFFINGSIVKKLCDDHEIYELLKQHQIGFHSSSHSVKPRIFEYIDVPDYRQAIEKAKKRETSNINPFTGKKSGKGGIYALQKAFPEKDIIAFKDPFDYFAPPHIEALRELGLEFVFSSDLGQRPIFHKGLTFYPRAVYIDGITGKFLQMNRSLGSILSPILAGTFSGEIMVIGAHPSHAVYSVKRLSFHYRNPMIPFRLKRKTSSEIALDLFLFRLFLQNIRISQSTGLLNTSPDLAKSKTVLNPAEIRIEKIEQRCLRISSGIFGYQPQFLASQLHQFFDSC